MVIKNLKIENFRNFEFEQIEFCDKVNIFYGKNGQGKTNLLEAINYFTNGKSCRNNKKEKDVIRFNEKSASLAAEFQSEKGNGIYSKIELAGKKSIYINGNPVEKLSEILGLVNTVLFMPSDIGAITGAPSFRREYMDLFISKNYPQYFKLLSAYVYILKQKNNMLKCKSISRTQLEIYNEKLSEYGVSLCEIRQKFTKAFSGYVSSVYESISESREKAEIVYKPDIEDFSDKSVFLKEIEDSAEKELVFGAGIRGAHRDDYEIRLNGKSAKFFGSRGQLRSVVLAMKTAESEIIKEIKGEYPIFLLDDVFSELDEARRRFLLSVLKDKQVVITLTNADIGKKSENIKYFEIENGKIK